MKKTYIATLCFSAVGLAPVIYADITYNDNDKVIALAFLIGFVLIVLGILSAVLFAFEKTKPYGKAAFLSMGIVLLIGFSVCSM